MRQVIAVDLLDVEQGTQIARHADGETFVGSTSSATQHAADIRWELITGTPVDDGGYVIVTIAGTPTALDNELPVVVRTIPRSVPLDALTLRILTHVHDGLVTVHRDDTIEILYGAAPYGEEYRLRVVTLLSHSWVMRPVEPNADGGHVLILTTIGDRYWWATNPERYTSPVAYRADKASATSERQVAK